MSKPVNLNQFRKAKARSEQRATADENAVKFGRGKTQKECDTAEAQKTRKTLDQHKRDP